MDTRTVIPDESLGGDVHRLPIPVPFPLPPVNAVYVDGKVPTLFDTGCRTEEGWAALHREAEGRGLDLDALQRIVLTHAHLDHAGNAARLADETGAEVWIHVEEVSVLEGWEDLREERNRSYEAGLVRAGLPAPSLARLAEEGRAVDVLMEGCLVDRALVDGDTFQAGDRTFRVLHTPGHTPGSSIFYDESGDLTITGDTILQHITPNALSVRREETGALARYLETLTRLRGTDLGTMVPGHGPAFRGLAETIDRALRLYHARRQRVIGFLQDAPGPATTWDIVTHEWDDTKGKAFLMTSEIQGHLDILVADGLVTGTEPEERDDGGGAALYRLVHAG